MPVEVVIVLVGTLSVEVIVVVIGTSPPDLDEMQGVVAAVMKWQMVMMSKSRTQATWENCVVMMASP